MQKIILKIKNIFHKELTKYDFSFSNEKIEIGKTVKENVLIKFESSINISFPSSYKSFLTNISNGVTFDIQNLLGLYSIKECVSFYLDKSFFGEPPPEFLIPFAHNGGGEFWAFYTKKKLPNNEFPIVWFDPGSIGSDAYFFCNSSFTSFINIEVQKLIKTDCLDISEVEIDNYYLQLYKKYDPKIKLKKLDFFQNAVDIKELEIEINSFK